MFGRLLDCYTIYIFSRALARNGILPRAKFTLRPTLALSLSCSYILAALLHGTRAVGVSESLRRRTRNGITELSQSAPPVLYSAHWLGGAAITLGIGPHSS